MSVKVGGKYYFKSHAYHHYIAEVVEITGKREAWCKNIIRVQSCQRGWTDFFAEGVKSDTNYTHFPDGSITWFNAFEWHHNIPLSETKHATRR